MERRVPLLQRSAHLLATRDEAVNLLVHGGKHPFRGRSHDLTGAAAAVAYSQESGNLDEREAEPLRVADQRKTADDCLRILSVTGCRARRFRQELHAFVVANRVRGDACRRRDFADREKLAHWRILRAP